MHCQIATGIPCEVGGLQTWKPVFCRSYDDCISSLFGPGCSGATDRWVTQQHGLGPTFIILRLVDQTFRGLPKWILPVSLGLGNGAHELGIDQHAASEK
ncbi:hypothetical protein HBI56_050270 [Parastagonospora nodorum]|uniref:Uncharacterized protein n=1 Tax=Phaeosphaeria nodorum (strain SN15 / ATCC MYA-4574 / FGSC 10173) TaxID=321614 RepID=A0A7U2ESB2_PHANO|nr:hypothetical protein HBH56_063200 [Parastagonospora nodorum]QRC92123.1 hypothetical protein JI435_401980 [Parastagonospora nodorum SN15]KAH3930952.1 hypothetical protein HBH54_107140 [Parastagonospora nodorum]KAH3954076.1 hypothetical protein HBH53_022080 [Parastagonospora nodorum]KAH3968180.1 hypothetical protein HBH51_131600 [Parastagonospora nodorum]